MTPSRRARAAVLGLLAALAGTLFLWQRVPLLSGSLLPLLWVGPLLLPLRGLMRGNRYTYAWSTLLVIGYVALALTEIIADPGKRLVPAAILFTAFSLFVALIAYLRLTRRSVSG